MISETVRVQKADGGWRSLKCRVYRDALGSVEVTVPEYDQIWLISPEGMTANIGGNDWGIYTLHQDDCRRICASV